MHGISTYFTGYPFTFNKYYLNNLHQNNDYQCHLLTKGIDIKIITINTKHDEALTEGMSSVGVIRILYCPNVNF